MATHFARGILTEGHLISVRLPSQCHQEARNIPPHYFYDYSNKFLSLFLEL